MQAPWRPTDEHREMAETMAGFGVPQADIAALMGVDIKTLTKYLRKELDAGIAKANMAVGRTLFQRAIGGDTTAAIFWAKTRMGWRETKAVEITGADGGPIELQAKVVDTRQLSDDARLAMRAALEASVGRVIEGEIADDDEE